MTTMAAPFRNRIPAGRAVIAACIAGLGFFAMVAGGAEASTPPPSPFIPKGGPKVVNAPVETLEFAGVSTLGKRTDLVIHDKVAKKSRWIGLGETLDGITVLNYDARLEQVVVRANGTEKVLSLRKASGPVNAPLPVVAPGPPIPRQPEPDATPLTPTAPMLMPAGQPAAATAQDLPRPTPTVQARQEEEARMLVSDLLEIGMAQRKAYEEAQKRGSGQKAPGSNPPSSAAPVGSAGGTEN